MTQSSSSTSVANEKNALNITENQTLPADEPLMRGPLTLTNEEREIEEEHTQDPPLLAPRENRRGMKRGTPDQQLNGQDQDEEGGEEEEDGNWWSQICSWFGKRQKLDDDATTNEKEEKQQLMKKLEHWLANDVVGVNDFKILEELTQHLDLLNKLQEQPNSALRFLVAKLRQKITATSAIHNPSAYAQRALAVGCSYFKGDPQLYTEIMDDKLISLQLEESVGDVVDEIPGLIKLGATVIGHLFKSDVARDTKLKQFIDNPKQPITTSSSTATLSSASQTPSSTTTCSNSSTTTGH